MSEHPKYDPKLIDALFWSEIADSHLICTIFDRHKGIVKSFIETYTAIDHARVDVSKLRVRKDKNYPGKGRIDIFLWIPQDFCVLLEIKVHDFKSAKPMQLADYYGAALSNASVTGFKDIYLIYLTQFSPQNFQASARKLEPKSFLGFETLHSQFPDFTSKTKHITWDEFHEFMGPYLSYLDEEEFRLLEMQRQWIKSKDLLDRERYGENRGKRDLPYFLDDIDLSWVTSFSCLYRRGKRIVIPLEKLSQGDLERLSGQIEELFESDCINQVELRQDDDAVKAGQRMVEGLQNEANNPSLLIFYQELFGLVNDRRYLGMKLSRPGRLAVNAKIHNKGKANLVMLHIDRNAIEIKIYEKGNSEEGLS